VLIRVNAGAQHSSAENGIVFTRPGHSINVDFSLAEAESVLRGEGALVDVADRNSSLVTTDASSAGNATETNEFGLNHVTIIIYA